MRSFRKISRLAKTEYPPYSRIYMDLVLENDDILALLYENSIELKNLLFTIPEEKLMYRYAKDKWTIKEILVHLIDDERIFCYRALRYARGDDTPLPGFDQDNYTKYSDANARSLDSIFEEYHAVRMATLSLFENLPEDAFSKSGWIVENGNITNKRTVRAMVYHIAGHELHHMNIIKEKYL